MVTLGITQEFDILKRNNSLNWVADPLKMQMQ